MSLPETTLQEVRVSEAIVAQGWQCCLLCGRTLTDRALHDALEEPVLAAIRAEHPEWSGVDGACQPCVSYYRGLLRERMTRDERLSAQALKRWPGSGWLNRLLGVWSRTGSFTGKPEN